MIGSPTFSSPTTQDGMSPEQVRSTIPSCLKLSTAKAIPDGSAANTSQPPQPQPVLGGPHGIWAHKRKQRRGVIVMKVGFIGLGIMGRPMAGHLIKGGHEVFLHS